MNRGDERAMNLSSHRDFVLHAEIARALPGKENDKQSVAQHNEDYADYPQDLKLLLERRIAGHQLGGCMIVCAEDPEEEAFHHAKDGDDPVALPDRYGGIADRESAHDQDVEYDLER